MTFPSRKLVLTLSFVHREKYRVYKVFTSNNIKFSFRLRNGGFKVSKWSGSEIVDESCHIPPSKVAKT
jgi:hypothetical protein